MSSHKSDLVDVHCLLEVERPMSVLASIEVKKNGKTEKIEAWLPKSQIEIEYTGKAYRGKAFANVTMPQWLAEEKELA